MDKTLVKLMNTRMLLTRKPNVPEMSESLTTETGVVKEKFVSKYDPPLRIKGREYIFQKKISLFITVGIFLRSKKPCYRFHR